MSTGSGNAVNLQEERKETHMRDDVAGLAMAALCAAVMVPVAAILGDWAGVVGCVLASAWFASPWAVCRWLDLKERRR